ncbi:site-2 protease family protein [Candidatus Campbellbacteria bacterium CG11_big_fil_rev_8_21_14_0_20_44_21]|nr:MAG: site-2 protease family protein [Candidatus Campbellbacteria bacterium CG11_big_fil_rev_8_21_14_0_20_44_21]
MQTNFIFSIIVLILSVALHEASHGYAAGRLGDPTARLAGRLTLNPLKHLDLFGSFIFPAMTYFLGGFILGWAKPVPYNPYNLKDQRWGEAKVAFAGPASNLIIAVIFGFFIRLGFVPESLLSPVGLIVFINILLAIFNLIPIPPLDGSKILFSILPYRHLNLRVFLERYSLFLILFFVFFLWRFFLPLIAVLFLFFTGFSL